MKLKQVLLVVATLVIATAGAVAQATSEPDSPQQVDVNQAQD